MEGGQSRLRPREQSPPSCLAPQACCHSAVADNKQRRALRSDPGPDPDHEKPLLVVSECRMWVNSGFSDPSGE